MPSVIDVTDDGLHQILHAVTAALLSGAMRDYPRAEQLVKSHFAS